MCQGPISAAVTSPMPGELPWGWYQLRADRGLWENRYAVMSDATVLSYESLSSPRA
jgi:hypothetical protein